MVSPTSLEPTTALFESDKEKEPEHHTLENEAQINDNPRAQVLDKKLAQS